MLNLPSTQNDLVEKAKAVFEKDDRLVIFEPCDCGDWNIRHFNGGNYHAIIYLAKDRGKFYRKDENTCEMNPPSHWEEITQEQAISAIEENADWLD